MRSRLKPFSLSVSPEGVATFIYTDALAPLLKEGKATIQRASYVEPDDKGQWWATMKPFGEEVVLGPFTTRQEALDEEERYLEVKLFGAAKSVMLLLD